LAQDRTRGAAAAEWGKRTGKALAQKLGATDLSPNSNACRLDGLRVAIKCAAPATDSVGVTYKMLEHLDAVIGAFQREDGAFDLWSLAPSVFKEHVRDSKSKRSRGKTGLVRRDVFESRGKAVGQLRL